MPCIENHCDDDVRSASDVFKRFSKACMTLNILLGKVHEREQFWRFVNIDGRYVFQECSIVEAEGQTE